MTLKRIGAMLMILVLVFPVVVSAQHRSDAAGPDLLRIRAGLSAGRAPALAVSSRALAGSLLSRRAQSGGDTLLDGLLIGTAVGVVAGWVWGTSMCPNDSECLAIARPVGMLAGFAIGAAAGAIIDALH